LGTSPAEVTVVDPGTQIAKASAQYPDAEIRIIAHQPGWAEQSADM